MNTSIKVTGENARKFEQHFSDNGTPRIVFSIDEKGKPVEVSFMHPNKRDYILIRSYGFSELLVEMTSCDPFFSIEIAKKGES